MFRTPLTTTLIAAAALLALPAMAAATTVKTYVYGGGQVLVSKHTSYEMVYTCDSGNTVRNDEVGAICEQDGFLFSNRVNITARPNAGYRFVGFLAPGNTCVGASDMCVATAWGAGTMTVHAHFVDDTPPNTAIINRPAARTSSRSASFALTSPQIGARFECKLDAEAFHACDKDVPMNNLSEGVHTLSARAIDPAGNVDPEPESYTWEVDTTGPTITMATPPAYTRAGVSLAMQGEPGGYFQCALQAPGQALASAYTCATPFVLDHPTDGTWLVKARGVDDLGNLGPWVTRSWVRDAASPTAFITGGPGEGATTSARVSHIAFGANDANPVTFTCAIDDGEAAACTSTFVTPSLADGQHSVRIQAKDGAGNSGTIIRTFSVDATAPIPTITSGPAEGSTTTARSATFGLSVDEDGATMRCELDGKMIEGACADEIAFSDLALGSHTLRVFAVDAVGNTSGLRTPAVRTWTIVTPTPDPVIDEPTPGKDTGGQQQLPQPAPVTPVTPTPNVSAADVTAPKLTVVTAKSLKLNARSRSLPLTVQCSEACTVTITGRATLGKVSSAIAFQPTQLGTAKRTLQIALPAKLRSALRASTKGTVKLTVVVTDAAGNRAVKIVQAKLLR